MIFRSVFSLMCLILSVLFLLLVQLGCMSPARTYLWATLHRKAGDYDEAISSYNAAIRRKPDYADAYHGLGLVYHEQKKYDTAIAKYTQAI